jgi:environmental stress-induced protein Ves
MIRLLRAADHRVMPWKNGGGSTTEIAVAPAGASIDNFDWRVSTATVAADGPFSLFPGVDRVLAVLAGAGIDLQGIAPRGAPSGSARIDRTSAPVAFAADVPVTGCLCDGPITDLNVMTRRGRFAARVRRAAEGAETVEVADGGTVLLFAVAPCRAAVDGGPRLSLGAADVLRVDGPATRRLGVDGDGGEVDAWLVEIAAADPA